MLNTETIRGLYPYLMETIDLRLNNPREHPRTFVDNTASTQMALPVMEKFLSSLFDYANIHRGEYDASQVSTERFERAYNIAANLINAESYREIIFGRNTTEMINLVVHSFEHWFRKNDNIVTTRLEHNSNYVPWWWLQQRLDKIGVEDVEIRMVDFDKETGELDMAQLESYVDNHTKLVAVTGASNFMGVKPDLKRIGEIAHSSGYGQHTGFNGSYLLVDAAQLIPASPVDVQDIDCDFLAWSFHKAGLPLGVGGLYSKYKVLSNLDPFLVGGDMIDVVREGEVVFKDLPWRYTAGTPNVLGTIATGYGIEFMINLGLDNLVSPNETETTVFKKQICRQIETDILMNTCRGDYQGSYIVPEEKKQEWTAYLKKHPDTIKILKNPDARLTAARNRVKTSMTNIMQHEEELIQYAIDGLSAIDGVELYGPLDAKKRTGLIAFNIKGQDPQTVAFELNKRHVETRNGDHCASLAHEYMGIDEGTLRMSFYVYNNKDDAERAVSAVKEIAKTK